jgi:hypothetical protein
LAITDQPSRKERNGQTFCYARTEADAQKAAERILTHSIEKISEIKRRAKNQFRGIAVVKTGLLDEVCEYKTCRI